MKVADLVEDLEADLSGERAIEHLKKPDAPQHTMTEEVNRLLGAMNQAAGQAMGGGIGGG